MMKPPGQGPGGSLLSRPVVGMRTTTAPLALAASSLCCAGSSLWCFARSARAGASSPAATSRCRSGSRACVRCDEGRRRGSRPEDRQPREPGATSDGWRCAGRGRPSRRRGPSRRAPPRRTKRDASGGCSRRGRRVAEGTRERTLRGQVREFREWGRSGAGQWRPPGARLPSLLSSKSPPSQAREVLFLITPPTALMAPIGGILMVWVLGDPGFPCGRRGREPTERAPTTGHEVRIDLQSQPRSECPM